jgi:hypothetical protein
MFQRFTLSLFLTLTIACTQPLPPTDKPLDAGAALDLILAGTQTAHPPVFGVTSDCQDMRAGGIGFGFFLDGGCRGGLTVSEGVFIVLHPDGGRYSMNLAHEVAGHCRRGGF